MLIQANQYKTASKRRNRIYPNFCHRKARWTFDWRRPIGVHQQHCTTVTPNQSNLMSWKCKGRLIKCSENTLYFNQSITKAKNRLKTRLLALCQSENQAFNNYDSWLHQQLEEEQCMLFSFNYMFDIKHQRRRKKPSSTKLTVSQHEHLACRVPSGYESNWRQEPQTIWAIWAISASKISKSKQSEKANESGQHYEKHNYRLRYPDPEQFGMQYLWRHDPKRDTDQIRQKPAEVVGENWDEKRMKKPDL